MRERTYARTLEAGGGAVTFAAVATRRLPELPKTSTGAGRNVPAFHAGALGDFVLTWPVLLGAARVMPQCRTIAVVAGDKGKLAERVLRVEHRDADVGGWHALFGDGDLPERAARLLGGARHVISFVADHGSKWAANVREVAPAATITFIAPPPRDLAGGHAGDFILRQLEGDPVLHAAAAGMRQSIEKTGLMPRFHDAGGPVLLHPGSGSIKKNRPVAEWAALARRLKEDGRKVRVVLGEAEVERLDEAEVAELSEHAADVQRPADLSELLFLMRGAGGYVGHDTGPTHLAAAVGLATTAVFTDATDSAVWAPIGPQITVVRGLPG